MFVLDDIVLRSLGIQLPIPFDMLSTLEAIQEAALKEVYDPKKLNNELKEISMLLEDRKINRKEFERRKEDIILRLKIADRVKEMGAKNKAMDIKFL